jgi:cation diffusion facilitator CzcD-associated flavoprotein CzcO
MILSDFVILATGLLNAPDIPKLESLERYQGKVFHTSRWNYKYTGGSTNNPMMKRLQDDTIAFIEAGASAVQVVLILLKG